MPFRETLPMYVLAFFLLLTNLPGLEGIFVQSTCGWICTAGPHIDERSRSMLAGGRLVKFRVLYEEQVQGECAKQTDATNSSATASLWLKMTAGGKPRKIIQGRLHLLTQTILEGIFSDQFALGANKKINISCVFNSTSTGKSALNYLSRRLTFQNLTSVLYFVEYVANYTKPSAAFLTLLRTEQNTRLSVGATSTPGSLSSTKDNELSFTDGWLAVAIIICILVLLYFPAIFILFRPSEIKLEIRQRTSEVQEGKHTAVEHEGSGDPETQPRQGDYIPFPRDFTGSREGSERPEGAGSLSSRIQPRETDQPTESQDTLSAPVQASSDEDRESDATPGSPAAELNHQDQDSENTPLRLYQSKSITFSHRDGPTSENISPNINRSKTWPPFRYGRVNIPKAEVARRNSPVVATKSSVNTRSSSRGFPKLFSSCFGGQRQEEKIDTPGPTEPHDTDTSNDSVNDTMCTVVPNQLSSNGNIDDLNSSQNRNNDSEQASTSQSNGNIEEPSAPSSTDDTRIDIHQPREEVEEETEIPGRNRNTLAIIVGETYPVGFGSWIGKKLFSTTHERNIAWNIVKLVFLLSALPLLFFLGLGDVFLVLLPKLHSKLSDHFPFAFLTPSLGYGFINNHPAVQVLIVLSVSAYLIRLCFLCFLPSSTVEASWRSCSVHRMHATCLACKRLQYFIIGPLSLFLKPCEKCSPWRSSSVHRMHTTCFACKLLQDCILGPLSLFLKSYKTCCNPAQSECETYLDLPENILHNLEKQSDIFIKYWDSFCKVLLDVWKPKRLLIHSVKGIFFPLAIIVDILYTSPLVCLCHWRLWMLTERYKNKFKWSGFILPVLDFLLMFLSLVWVTIFSLLYTIPLGVAIVGLIKVLGNHTNEVLPQVTITVLAVHYFWTCYRSFRTPYRYVVKFLASRYQKKYDEQENTPVVNVLIHYKQGDLKVIPKELFEDGCKEFKLSKKNNVAWLVGQLVCTLLAFSFIFPILASDEGSDSSTTTPIVTFLAVAYGLISNAISGEEFQISKVQADKVVNDYIARKQRDSS